MTYKQFLEKLKITISFEHSIRMLIGFDPKNSDECLKAVERNGYALRYVKDQSEAVCLKAVESDGDALRYVKEEIFE